MKIKYFKLAKKLSYYSTHYRAKLGCVIVKKNKIIGLGANKLKTNPYSVHPYNQVHAEISAILDSDNKKLKGSSLYIYREHANGIPALSKPCKYCQILINSVGIKKVFYTDRGNFCSLYGN